VNPSDRHCGCTDHWALMRFLCKQNQMMPGAISVLEAVWKRQVNGALYVPVHSRDPGQAPRHGNVHQGSSGVFATKYIRTVHIIGEDGDNLHLPRGRTCQWEGQVRSIPLSLRRQYFQICMLSRGGGAKGPIQCGTITPDKLLATVQHHLRCVWTFRRKS
jgi:hypothetical protein